MRVMKPVLGSESHLLNGSNTLVRSQSPPFWTHSVTGFNAPWSQSPTFLIPSEIFSPMRSMNGLSGSPSLPPKRLTFRSRKVSDRPFFMLVQMPSLPRNVSFSGAKASFMADQICPSAPPWRFRIGLPWASVPTTCLSPNRAFAIGLMMLVLIVSPSVGKMPRSLYVTLPKPSSRATPAPNRAFFMGARMNDCVSPHSFDMKSLPFWRALPKAPPERLPSAPT